MLSTGTWTRPCGKMLLDALENLVQKINTAYGDLSMEYLAPKLHKMFGTGQGSGSSPHFCTAISEVILYYFDKYLPGLHSSNPNGTVTCIRNEDAFVDKLGLAANDTSGSQTNEKYHFVTGGKLALEKSFLTLVEWVWNNGQVYIAPYIPTSNQDSRVKLVSSEDGRIVVLRRIDPSDQYRTLGVLMAILILKWKYYTTRYRPGQCNF